MKQEELKWLMGKLQHYEPFAGTWGCRRLQKVKTLEEALFLVDEDMSLIFDVDPSLHLAIKRDEFYPSGVVKALTDISQWYGEMTGKSWGEELEKDPSRLAWEVECLAGRRASEHSLTLEGRLR